MLLRGVSVSDGFLIRLKHTGIYYYIYVLYLFVKHWLFLVAMHLFLAETEWFLTCSCAKPSPVRSLDQDTKGSGIEKISGLCHFWPKRLFRVAFTNPATNFTKLVSDIAGEPGSHPLATLQFHCQCLPAFDAPVQFFLHVLTYYISAHT